MSVSLVSGICVDCNFQMKPLIADQHKELKFRISKIVSEDMVDILDYEKLFKEAVTVLHPYDSDFMSLMHILWKEYFTVNNNAPLLPGT